MKIRQLTANGEYVITPIVVNTHEYAFLDHNQLTPTVPTMV
jgi:hypothetical protein